MSDALAVPTRAAEAIHPLAPCSPADRAARRDEPNARVDEDTSAVALGTHALDESRAQGFSKRKPRA